MVFHRGRDVGPASGKKLRILDGLEEYFWLAENTFPRTTMIVALARKLLIALWRFVTTGEVPQGVVLHPAE